jgi:hypothetical protein
MIPRFSRFDWEPGTPSKINDLGEAVPALQECFQSREGALTKVGICGACTVSAGAFHWELVADSQKPKAKSQKPKAKSQKPKAKSQPCLFGAVDGEAGFL